MEYLSKKSLEKESLRKTIIIAENSWGKSLQKDFPRKNHCENP